MSDAVSNQVERRRPCGFCGGVHQGLCLYAGNRAGFAGHPVITQELPPPRAYTGPAKVRVLPPGVSGEDEFGRPKAVTAWLRRAGHRGAASKRRARG